MRNRETIEKTSTWLVVAMMIASGGVNIAGIKPPFAAATRGGRTNPTVRGPGRPPASR